MKGDRLLPCGLEPLIGLLVLLSDLIDFLAGVTDLSLDLLHRLIWDLAILSSDLSDILSPELPLCSGHLASVCISLTFL